MAINRWNMKGKLGHYVESLEQSTLQEMRKDLQFIFRGARITKALQIWGDIVKINVVYPPYCKTRRDFIKYNKKVTGDKKR